MALLNQSFIGVFCGVKFSLQAPVLVIESGYRLLPLAQAFSVLLVFLTFVGDVMAQLVLRLRQD